MAPDPTPLLPLRTGVLFPGTTFSVPVGRRQSLILLETLEPGAEVVVGVQRDPRVADPGIADLHPVATLARLVRVSRRSELHVTLEGLRRCHVDSMVSSHPRWEVEASPVEEVVTDEQEARALAELLLEKVRELELEISGGLATLLRTTSTTLPGQVADHVAAALGLPADREAQVLQALDVNERLRLVHRLIGEAEQLAEIRSRVARELQSELGKSQREALLRQQLRAIRKELGEEEGPDATGRLRERLEQAELPEEAEVVVERELRRLEGMGPGSPEAHVIRGYLELIADLPWTTRAEVSEDLDAVQRKLDEDHYGLSEVKRRILEHLAVRKMTGSDRGAILCLTGPPGVGKTSLGQSVAEATGRPLARVALGGVRDEAEIRGHRRTYVGALPGRILAALRKAGVKNPLVVLDEVDKLGLSWMGSPEAALLEVLDPEQNHTFTDHYLELPFDLSEVLFLCTANTVESLSPPLRDRMELIEIQGYTDDEKREIARRHLLPAALEEHGLPPGSLEITDEALDRITADYTREAGVRQLRRELARICRSVTLDAARRSGATKGRTPTRVGPGDLRRFLGKERFFNEVAERTAFPGIATGLAWTPTGGEILFVEASRMPGKGRLEITGKLGDVMKESARAALTYVRSHADELGLDPTFLEAQDLHIHVPAGAVPKDGPSAGVTIFTALASLLTGRRARADTAMTGECTLRGRVLPVGGIKAKVLAAHRAGVGKVLLPGRNRRDVDEEVPTAVLDDLELVFVDDMGQVLAAALEPPTSPSLPLPSPGDGGVSEGVGVTAAQTNFRAQ